MTALQLCQTLQALLVFHASATTAAIATTSTDARQSANDCATAWGSEKDACSASTLLRNVLRCKCIVCILVCCAILAIHGSARSRLKIPTIMSAVESGADPWRVKTFTVMVIATKVISKSPVPLLCVTGGQLSFSPVPVLDLWSSVSFERSVTTSVVSFVETANISSGQSAQTKRIMSAALSRLGTLVHRT